MLDRNTMEKCIAALRVREDLHRFTQPTPTAHAIAMIRLEECEACIAALSVLTPGGKIMVPGSELS
jgi:hypothetical protein